LYAAEPVERAAESLASALTTHLFR